MHLNGEHAVIHELDIYGKVGRGAAHDEVIPFSVRNGKLKINGETSEVIDGKISVEFVKVSLLLLCLQTLGSHIVFSPASVRHKIVSAL